MLIVDKETRRINFVTEEDSRCLHVLYSPVSYDYIEAQVVPEVAAQPWHYLWNGAPLYAEFSDFGPMALKAERAFLLLAVAASVRRCRSLVSTDVDSQEIYVAKLSEANSVINGDLSNVPFLERAAEFHGITVQEEATAVLFRHQQRRSVLLSTEDWRQRMVHRVLVSPLHELQHLRTEASRYDGS